MPDRQPATYEEYCSALEKTYGKGQEYLLFTARVDSVYGMEPDFAFLKEDAYQDAFDIFIENMEACDRVNGVTESEFATIALCCAVVADCVIDKRAVSPAEIFEALVNQVGAGLYTNASMISLMANNGREEARELWKKRDFKKMSELVNAVFGRMTNDWKETYDSKYDINSKDQMNKRVALGFLSVKLIEVVLRNTDLLGAINQKKMENGLIMAEKINMYLEGAKAKVLLASHGEPQFSCSEGDREGEEANHALCEFADGFVLSDKDFATANLAIVLPYLYESVKDRSFTEFEKNYQAYGVRRASGLYEKAMLETLACLYKNDDEETTKRLRETMKKEAVFAKVVEERAREIFFREMSNFEKKYYGGFFNLFRKLLHKLLGKYEKNMKGAEKVIRLNGGHEPQISEISRLKEIKKETYESRLGAFQGDWLKKHGFLWEGVHDSD